MNDIPSFKIYEDNKGNNFFGVNTIYYANNFHNYTKQLKYLFEIISWLNFFTTC